MLKPSEIPPMWREVLERIQTLDPHAVIAGGCLRDLDHRKPIKDLDIMVSFTTDDNKLGELMDSDITNEQDSFSDELCAKSYTLDVDGLDIPLNIVRCGESLVKPTDRVVQFDLGLCQVVWPGRGYNVDHKPAYTADYYDK